MRFEEDNGTLRCFFEGSINSEVCMRLEPELTDRVAVAQKTMPSFILVFDMSEANYICSAFLRFCIYYCKHLGAKNFRIEHVSADIKKVFVVAGFTEIMTILP